VLAKNVEREREIEEALTNAKQMFTVMELNILKLC
jgi:hypothetical protein